MTHYLSRSGCIEHTMQCAMDNVRKQERKYPLSDPVSWNHDFWKVKVSKQPVERAGRWVDTKHQQTGGLNVVQVEYEPRRAIVNIDSGSITLWSGYRQAQGRKKQRVCTVATTPCTLPEHGGGRELGREGQGGIMGWGHFQNGKRAVWVLSCSNVEKDMGWGYMKNMAEIIQNITFVAGMRWMSVIQNNLRHINNDYLLVWKIYEHKLFVRCHINF